MELALLDHRCDSLNENLALDEALLRQAEEHGTGEWLRFWSWPELAVVLGAGGELEKDVELAQCQRDQVPIHRRSSGGGTVLLGPGCLLFSLILSVDRAAELRHVNASYRWILERLVEALQPLGRLRHEGICDLTFDGKKCSGNAQQRKQRFILHHGTLLYDFDLSHISRYLKLPERRPEYRADRPHSEFVTNLPTDAVQLKELLIRKFGATAQPRDLPWDEVATLIREKYRLSDWVQRR